LQTALSLKTERAYAQDQAGILTNDQFDYPSWEKLPANVSTAVFAADWPDIEYEISSAPFGTPSANTPASPIDERVVDASAFPMLTPGHSKAMVCVLAEKIAADILAGK
jgi:hypothetical protein